MKITEMSKVSVKMYNTSVIIRYFIDFQTIHEFCLKTLKSKCCYILTGILSILFSIIKQYKTVSIKHLFILFRKLKLCQFTIRNCLIFQQILCKVG